MALASPIIRWDVREKFDRKVRRDASPERFDLAEAMADMLGDAIQYRRSMLAYLGALPDGELGDIWNRLRRPTPSSEELLSWCSRNKGWERSIIRYLLWLGWRPVVGSVGGRTTGGMSWRRPPQSREH